MFNILQLEESPNIFVQSQETQFLALDDEVSEHIEQLEAFFSF